MNTLLAEIIRSLKELQLGFAGELTMSDAMESLMDALYLDKVGNYRWKAPHMILLLITTIPVIRWICVP